MKFITKHDMEAQFIRRSASVSKQAAIETAADCILCPAVLYVDGVLMKHTKSHGISAKVECVVRSLHGW